MASNWIKLHRKLIDSRLHKNSRELHIWIHCLLRASYKTRWVLVRTGSGTKTVEIKPGQFIFGAKSVAKATGLKVSTVRNILIRLEKWGKVNRQVDTHFTLVTICNWDAYQGNGEADEHPDEQADNTQVTSRCAAGNTNKKVKKGEEGCKNEDPQPKPPRPKPRPKAKESHSEHTKFVEWFCEGYETAYQVKYNFKGGRDGKIVKDMLTKHGFAGLKRIAQAMFDSDDKWDRENACVSLMSSQDHKWLKRNAGETSHYHLPKTPAEIQRAIDLGVWDEKNNCMKEKA